MQVTEDEIDLALAELTECSTRLREVLVHYERANMTLRRLLGSGTPAMEALERVGSQRIRPELSHALDEFAGARHKARVALLVRAADQGATMAEAGRAFSVSRQLVSRLIAEAGGQP